MSLWQSLHCPARLNRGKGLQAAGPWWGAGGSGGPGLGCRCCGGASVPLCQHGGVLARAGVGGTLCGAGPSHLHMPGCWVAESFPMLRLISHSSSDLFSFSHFNKDESIRKRGCTRQRARSDIIKKWLQSGCFPNGLSYQPARPCTPCAPNPLRHHLHFLITPH